MSHEISKIPFKGLTTINIMEPFKVKNFHKVNTFLEAVRKRVEKEDLTELGYSYQIKQAVQRLLYDHQLIDKDKDFLSRLLEVLKEEPSDESIQFLLEHPIEVNILFYNIALLELITEVYTSLIVYKKNDEIFYLISEVNCDGIKYYRTEEDHKTKKEELSEDEVRKITTRS